MVFEQYYLHEIQNVSISFYGGKNHYVCAKCFIVISYFVHHVSKKLNSV